MPPITIWPSMPMLNMPGAGGDGEGQSAQDERRRRDQRLGNRALAAEGSGKEGLVGGNGILTGERDDDAAREQGDGHGEQRVEERRQRRDEASPEGRCRSLSRQRKRAHPDSDPPSTDRVERASRFR